MRLAAVILAAGTAGLLGAPAMAAPGSAVAGARHAAGGRPWIAITSMTPGYAQSTGKVTVSGIVINPGGSPLRAASVQILSTLVPLDSQEMAGYLTAQQPTGTDLPILGAKRTLPAPVPAQGTEPWSLTLTAHQLGMTSFGVYPVTAQLNVTDPALGATQPVDYASTFLPYWPGKQAAKKTVRIAWVWPLIDTPQQTVCGTLTTNELAANVDGGRLSSLLAAGQTPAAQQAQLTWAIDPALISDVSAISKPYRVTGTGGCSDGKVKQPSRAAGTWLAGVQKVAAHQDFFTTPYADVDVTALALAHGGLYGELAAAFADGHLAVARTKVPGTQKAVLGATQRVTPATAGTIAWPAGGIASYFALEALAAKAGVGTVILSSNLIHTPATVTRSPNGSGGELNVLLANATLTKILSTRRDDLPGLVPGNYTTPPGAREGVREATVFAKSQWFSAETAMIAATAPAAGRAVVVAPPRRWNPLPGMTGALLANTVTSPWLQPTTLAGLVSTHSAPGQLSRELPGGEQVTRGDLSGSLLNRVQHLSQQVQLLDSILPKSARGYLSTSVDTAESSAWRGGRANLRHAKGLVRRDLAYVEGRLHQVKIVGHLQVTLGGQNGVVPVSVSNGLSQPVTVKLVARAPPGDHVTIGKSTNVFTDVITVQAHEQRVIKISVTAAQAGPTVITLRLATPGGTPLPVRSSTLTVVATHFGTLAIVIISIALAVFLVTATARAIRSRPQDDGSGAEAEELDPMPSTRDPASAGGETDSVVSRGADDRQPAKEADEHASTPGTADRS